MKKIFCPKCDTPIPLTRQRIDEMRAKGEERISLVCPQCARQLNLRIRLPREEGTQQAEKPALGSLTVIENVFAHKQTFPLFLGDNHIGRRNTMPSYVSAKGRQDGYASLYRMTIAMWVRSLVVVSSSHVSGVISSRVMSSRLVLRVLSSLMLHLRMSYFSPFSNNNQGLAGAFPARP